MSPSDQSMDGDSAARQRSAIMDAERRCLATRIAWMYFVEGLKQEEVAAALGISRLRVNRLLAAARETGLVRIEITSPDFGTVDLEERLRSRFGLQRVRLVPTPADPRRTREAVGHGLGLLLNETLRDGSTVGAHHGPTMHALFASLRPARFQELAVVALKGALSQEGRMVPQETVGRLALTLEARGYQLAAPSYARSPEERDLFLGLPVVQAVLERARACNLALLTASRVLDDGGLVGTGHLTPDEAAALRSRGAVAGLLGIFLDAEGQPVAHPLNTRRIGLELEDLDRIPEVVLVGGGPGKVLPLRAALRRQRIHTLVADVATTEAILAG